MDKVQHRKEIAPMHKGCFYLYEGGQEEDDEEEEIMPAICYSGETYSTKQPNREDEEYYMQLNQ